MMFRRALNPRNVVLLIVCLMYLITYMDRVNIATAGPAIQKELGLSNRDFGLAISAFAYPYAFFQIAGGWLGDFLGARWTLVICGTLWSAATVLIGGVSGFASLFAARILLGFGEGAAFPTATRALASWTPATKRGWAQGITHAFARFGNAITPPLFAALIAVYSWRYAFVVVGVASFLWVAVWYWYFRDDPRQHSGMKPEDMSDLPEIKPRLSQGATPWLPLLKRILPVTLTDFCYGWTLWVYISWMPSFFVHDYQLDLKKAAFFSSAVLFAGVVGDTVGGLLSDLILRMTGNVATARVSVIVLGFVGCFVFTVPILMLHDLVTIAACLSAAFFFAELIVAPIWAVPMDIAPEYSGTASGFMNFGFGMAGMISPVVFGWIIDSTGRWDYPFIASLGLLLIGAGLAFTMRPGERFEPAAARRPIGGRAQEDRKHGECRDARSGQFRPRRSCRRSSRAPAPRKRRSIATARSRPTCSSAPPDGRSWRPSATSVSPSSRSPTPASAMSRTRSPRTIARRSACCAISRTPGASGYSPRIPRPA